MEEKGIIVDTVKKKKKISKFLISLVSLIVVTVVILLACNVILLPVKSVETGIVCYNNTVSATVQYKNISGNSWYNAKLAAERIDGLVLEPGETFSWFEVVGNCGKAEGYKAGIGIGRYGIPILDYGGGICVCSSVVYQCENAKGMETIERHNHSSEVSYAELGNDSAINDGTLDLKFKNTTGERVVFSIEFDDSVRTMTCTCIIG